MSDIKFNKCLTPIDELKVKNDDGTYSYLEDLPKEVQELFFDFLNNVPFIRWMVSPDRPMVSELPRDDEGKVIIDVTRPPILENTDFFRPMALLFKDLSCFTKLKPNANPNSEYGKWLLEERRRAWDGLIDPSTGMWVTGDMYWMLNYCPMHLVKKGKNGITLRTVDFPAFWDGQFLVTHYIQLARWNGKHGSELASRGKGKAHPYSLLVYTPDGVKQWGDIKVGDTLFGDDGNPTKVTMIPFDAEEKIYTVTLADGRSLKCTSGHLFKVKDKRKHPSERVVSLWEIMHSDYAHKRLDGGIEYYYAIPNNGKVEFKSLSVLVDPYTLGLLLGDGTLTNNSTNSVGFTSRDEDVVTYKEHIPYEIRSRKGNYAYSILINGIKSFLQEWGLDNATSEKKFIPKEYLFNSSDVRMALLLGLMDTDGTVNSNKVPMITTTSKRLARDIRWLCHSLGYNSTMFTKQGKYKDDKGVHICKLNYNITILTNDPIFRLERKLVKLGSFNSAYSRSRKDWTRIVDIKYSHREKAKCVIVDNKSHCYLIDEFIVTHNTSLGGALLSKRFILGETSENQSEVQCLVTAADRTKLIGTNQILNVFVDDIDFCAKNAPFDNKRLQSSVLELSWLAGYKRSGSDVKYGSKNSVMGIISGVNQDKLNGSRGVLYIIEEAGIFKDLLSMINLIRPSVEQGTSVFGLLFLYGCVCAGTKVWTNNGRYINIEDLLKEDGIIGYADDAPVKNTIGTLLEPKQKPCVRIEWEHGGFLECSIDHPILKQVIHTPRIKGTLYSRNRTPEEVWTRAGQLKVGDRILEGRQIEAFGNDTLEDPRLIGMLIGDGSYGYDNTPKFSSEDEELLNYIKRKYEWGISAQHVTKDGKLYQDIRVKGICPLLRNIGIYGQTKTAKRLPVKYQTLTKEDTKLLLAGLYDTDGCISGCGNGTSIQLTQCNKEILEQVKMLLRKFGILSTIAQNKPSIKEGRKDKNPWFILRIAGRTSIQLFYENVPLMQRKKVAKLEEWHNWSVENPLQRTKCYDDKSIIPHTVHSIKYIGIQTIYNLSAEQSHTYLANNIITHNTAGDSQSNFQDFQEIIYSPNGYNMYPLPNVYDKEGLGRQQITVFYPAYLNKDDGCMDNNGNSNVTKALLELLVDRYKIKYGSTDINTITKRVSQYPITPQEAILQTNNTMFPVSDLNERLNQLDNNPSEYDDVYIGELVQRDGKIEFNPTGDLPIRDFPTKDNKLLGALEIFAMPLKDPKGNVFPERYIIGLDPIDNDLANTMSFGSMFVLDLWTDTIVAEYTGRPPFANDLYELVRKTCLFYNAKCLYENNLHGIFSYFSQHNCTYLLADTPEYLKERDLIKTIGTGNTSKGVRAGTSVIKYAFKLIRDWLMKPVTKIERDAEGNEIETSMPNLYRLRNRALIKEMIVWNPNINVDRCVLGNTQILTSQGIKLIQDISLEDKVLTLNGEYNSVCQLHKNPYVGQIYSFRALGDYRMLHCTYNHPVLARHKTGASGKYWMKTKYNMSMPAYKDAQDITKDDFVLVPKRTDLPKCTLNDDLLYLIGWYIADGNISSGNYVKFSLQEDQYEIALVIQKLLNKYWKREYTLIPETTRRLKDRTIKVSAYTMARHVEAKVYKSYNYKGKSVGMWNVEIASKEAKNFFAEYGGTPNNKDINDSLYNTTGLLPLVRGFFEGDGHYRCEVRCDGVMRNSLEVNSIYEKLIHKIRQILLDEGIWCTIRRVKPGRLMKHEQYNINITNENVIPIIQGSLKFKQDVPACKHTNKTHYILDDCGFWVKVKDLSSYVYDGYVYNIGVEKDHTYCANGIVTHNCMAMAQLMLYREEKMVLYHGDLQGGKNKTGSSGLEEDPYFAKNYRFGQTSIQRVTIPEHTIDWNMQ